MHNLNVIYSCLLNSAERLVLKFSKTKFIQLQNKLLSKLHEFNVKNVKEEKPVF